MFDAVSALRNENDDDNNDNVWIRQRSINIEEFLPDCMTEWALPIHPVVGHLGQLARWWRGTDDACISAACLPFTFVYCVATAKDTAIAI